MFLNTSPSSCRSISITNFLPDAAKVGSRLSGPLRGGLYLPTSRIFRSIGIGGIPHKVRETQGPFGMRELVELISGCGQRDVYRVEHGFELVEEIRLAGAGMNPQFMR